VSAQCGRQQFHPEPCGVGEPGFDHSMNFTRINTNRIPDDVPFLINVIVFAVIILCAALDARNPPGR
jgi:hypothetical protein